MKGQNKGKRNGNYTTGITIRLRKKMEKEHVCKVCGSSKNLVIHHLDKNSKNNNWGNLVVLCNQCHNILHQRGYNFTNGEWKINVSEYFTSLQAEGVNCGTPSHFIRLFGCNLNCVFCDSDYSKKGKFQELTYIDIINICQKWKKMSKIDRVVITGGEPFLQNIVPLLLIFRIFDFKVEIETNGTLPMIKGNNGPTLLQRIYKKGLVELFNISPKLKQSQPYHGPGRGQKLINKDSIEQFKQMNYILKFVVKDEEDVKQVLKIKRRCDIPDSKIWLMPLSNLTDKDKDLQIKRNVWDYCVKNKIKYTPRIHRDVFGSKVGV